MALTATVLILAATLAAPTAPPPPADTSIRPFRVHLPQAAIDDLKRRIAMTRWPDKETVGDASQGTQLARIKPLVEYWGGGYDWRKAEAKLNALPQFTTTIDGVDIYFIQVKSKERGALPVIITHGWPGSVFELLKTIDPLTNPTAHGGAAADAFDVVIPAIPGYGFSGKPTGTGWDPEHIARAWAELMKRLGYGHYVAQGGDWGAVITLSMARQAPPGLAGIHLNLVPAIPPEVAAAIGSGTPPAGLSAEEGKAFATSVAGAKSGALAYFTMLTARPQTVGYAVTDSPVGLAAWTLVHPGFAHWAYGGDPSRSPSRDDVLDDISLYWLTNSGTSAGRLYWENHGRSPALAGVWKTNDIALPVAVSVFEEDAYQPPKSWVQRAYSHLIYYNKVPKGGHFAAWEQPELFSAELRAAFRPLR
jgi:pimeloyl-ACP methyl ester carboxylesterase